MEPAAKESFFVLRLSVVIFTLFLKSTSSLGLLHSNGWVTITAVVFVMVWMAVFAVVLLVVRLGFFS